jgi:hypothetical protein
MQYCLILIVNYLELSSVIADLASIKTVLVSFYPLYVFYFLAFKSTVLAKAFLKIIKMLEKNFH